MDKTSLDRIHIRDLLVRCIIGIYDDERREKQDVIINLTLYADLSKACFSDQIDDTVNYKALKKRVMALVEASECFLVERLAQQIADLALEVNAVRRVDVSVDKPGALRFARSVAVAITRTKEGADG